MYNEQTTKTMIEAVEAAKKTARSAEADFDRGSKKVQSMAAQRIRLGVGTAVGKVSDIAALVRKTSEELYATLQMLVGLVDGQCRPLLEKDPDPAAIRQVRDLIRKLNEDCEIENTFNASVNDISRGEMVAISYRPTLENKMIEKFWDTIYQSHPDRLASEKAEQEKEKHEKAKKEAKVKAENDTQNKKYQNELAAWTAKKTTIQAKRDAEVQKELTRLKAERKADIEKRHRESVKQANNGKTYNENMIKHHEKALATLSFIHFLKRKDHKEKLGYARQGLAQMEAALAEAERLYQEELQGLDAWVESQKAALEEKARARYPMPKKPRKFTHYTNPQEVVDEWTRETIYEEMEVGRKYTIDELMESLPILADMTRSRVLGHIRAMTGKEIERLEEAHAAYFRLMES